MFLRKIAKIIRGNATPFQLFSACLIGSMLGFMPAFATAGGLIGALLLALIILNANLALAAMTGLLAKLISLLLMPTSFAVGRFLLDGPAEGLFRSLINAPVLALFGFEYYATTGGLAIGIVLGSAAGWMMVRAVSGYRRKLKELENNSEPYQKYSQKGWVKTLSWILLGGAPKKVDYDALLAKKVGNPIRVLGVVFAALFVGLLIILYQFAAEPIVTAALRGGLERANGATIDLDEANLNLKENRLTLIGLAVTDPNALETDLFRADELQADIRGMELLRKRLQLDQVKLVNATSGQQRNTPGRLIGKRPEPAKETRPISIPDAKTVDEYLKNAQEWKERLAQARQWLEKLGQSGEEPTQETWQERLAREIREKGYARVQAAHLIEGSPAFTILELIANGVKVAQLPDETLDVTGKNLSTHPHLLNQAPELQIRSPSGNIDAMVRIGQFASSQETNRWSLRYRGLPVDTVAKQLTVKGTQPLSGGTMDVAFDGTLEFAENVMVDFPLQVTLHDTTLQLPGLNAQSVRQFTLPIGVRGPLDNPRLLIDDQQLQNALVKAGVSRLKEELGNKAQEVIQEKLGEKIGERGKGLLDGLIRR